MKRLSLGLLLTLAGCAVTPAQDPPTDLVALAAVEPPKVVAPAPVLPSPAPPPPASDTFRAWVPPRTAPDGTRSEGHWTLIPLVAPVAESVEPVKIVPRLPHTLPPAKAPAPAQS